MSENFTIEIISPEKKMLSGKVSLVIIPGFEGEMTILPDHISLITFLKPGFIVVEAEKKSQYFVEEGTVEFSNNNLSILSSSIIEFDSMKKEKIQKMIEESITRLKNENLNDKERYIIEHKLDCLSRLN